MRSRIKPPPDLNLFQRGPMRAIHDHKHNDIRIETATLHPEGEGLLICRMPLARKREAQAIAALPDLIKAGGPFAALGITVMAAEPEDPLIYHDEDVHVTVSDVHRMTDAMSRACIPPEKRVAMPWHGPEKGPKLKP